MAEPANQLPDAGPTGADRRHAFTRPLGDRAGVSAHERARRRARIEHREYARNSSARFWVMLAVLALITVILGSMAFREIQTSFGIFQ